MLRSAIHKHTRIITSLHRHKRSLIRHIHSYPIQTHKHSRFHHSPWLSNPKWHIPIANTHNLKPILSHTQLQNRHTNTPSNINDEPRRSAHPDKIYEYESFLPHQNDAKVIFELIFEEIKQKMGGDFNMVFPKDIMWLCGAPGSGKGEMSQWIMYQRGYHAEPIRISQILTGNEVEQLKNDGKLVSDRIVISILLHKLLLPEYRTGLSKLPLFILKSRLD